MRFIVMDGKENITENKVIINERGEIEFLLTEETKKLGHVDIEEGKRLIAEIIKTAKEKNHE